MKNPKMKNPKMKNQKVKYKIGDKIEKSELLEVANGIAIKGVKVIASNGDVLAFDILERKKAEIFEDIKMAVVEQLLIDKYVITRECYHVIRSELYKRSRDTMQLVVDNMQTDAIDILEKKAYIEYINNDGQIIEKSKTFKLDKILENLTNRQKEIIEMYISGSSMQYIATLLNISKSSVSTTIYRLREKIKSKEYELF